jgi:hypothetical protein
MTTSVNPFSMAVRVLIPFGHSGMNGIALRELNDRIGASRWREEDFSIWMRMVSARGDSLPAIRHLYRQELDEHVEQWLFSKGEGCTYFQVRSDLTAQWFDPEKTWATAIEVNRQWKVRANTNAGIEMFLSPFGVGVVSVALELSSVNEIDDASAIEFVYRLIQFDTARAAIFGKKHISEEPARFARIPEEKKSLISSPPAVDAPIEQRLGKEGGRFAILELVAWLLSPVKDRIKLNLDTCHPLVYAVATCQHTASLESAVFRDATENFLTKLANAEEPGHPGPLPGHADLPQLVVNRSHMVILSPRGAAHLTIHQFPLDSHGVPQGFDNERSQRIIDKYFVAYLITLLQRLSLQLLEDNASETVLGNVAGEHSSIVGELRLRLLKIDASCPSATMSTRGSVHRFHELCRESLGVLQSFDLLRSTLASMDAIETNKRMEAIADSHQRNTNELVEMQRKVEWVEVFLISVYAVYVIHYTGENFDFAPWYIGISIIVGMLVSAASAILLMRPHEHSSSKNPIEPHGLGASVDQYGVRSPWTAIAKRASIPIVLMAIYLVIGFWLRKH